MSTHNIYFCGAIRKISIFFSWKKSANKKKYLYFSVEKGALSGAMIGHKYPRHSYNQITIVLINIFSISIEAYIVGTSIYNINARGKEVCPNKYFIHFCLKQVGNI